MTETGGPAFPVLEVDEHRQPFYLHTGMTLRDYFAAKAMQGILANDEAMQQLMSKGNSGNLDRSARECVADIAFRYADAMLAAARKAGAK